MRQATTGTTYILKSEVVEEKGITQETVVEHTEIYRGKANESLS